MGTELGLNIGTQLGLPKVKKFKIVFNAWKLQYSRYRRCLVGARNKKKIGDRANIRSFRPPQYFFLNFDTVPNIEVF